MILLKGKPYTPGTPFTSENGTQFPGNWYSYATPQERTAQGFTEVADPAPVDERFYYVNTDGTVTPKSLDHCKSVVKNQLASLRWSKENEGIIYSAANALFQTDSASRVNYLGVLQLASTNAQFQTIWKARDVENTSSKFVTLTSSDVIAVYASGMDYISKCFQNEDAIVDLIDSPSITTLDQLLQINTNANWPSRTY